MRVFQSMTLLVVVLSLLSGCSVWLEGFGRFLNHYPVNVIKTRDDIGLIGSVRQVTTEGVYKQAEGDQNAGLLDTRIEMFSESGLLTDKQIKGPAIEQHECFEVKWGNPVKRLIRKNGELILKQAFRYDALGNIIKLDLLWADDGKTTVLTAGDSSILSEDGQVQRLDACFNVIYFENKQLFYRCGDGFLYVVEVDNAGRVLRMMTFPQGVNLIVEIDIESSREAVEYGYDQHGRKKNRAQYVEGRLLQAHRYNYGDQGELLLEEFERFGLSSNAGVIVYKSYQFDDQGNWTDRIIEHYEIKDKKRVLKRTETLRRMISYYQ